MNRPLSPKPSQPKFPMSIWTRLVDFCDQHYRLGVTLVFALIAASILFDIVALSVVGAVLSLPLSQTNHQKRAVDRNTAAIKAVRPLAIMSWGLYAVAAMLFATLHPAVPRIVMMSMMALTITYVVAFFVILARVAKKMEAAPA